LSSASFIASFKQKKPWRVSRKDCYSLLGCRIEEPRPTVRTFLIAEILAFIPSRFFLQHPPVTSVQSSESESVAELPSSFCYKSDSFSNNPGTQKPSFYTKKHNIAPHHPER
jgi:hypothetical protein